MAAKAKKVGIEGLEDALGQILSEYVDEVQRGTANAVSKVSRRASKALREESQRTFGSPDGKYRYAKGWRSKTQKDRMGGATAVVYNATAPGLTHLLERGHANRDGGRTEGRTHIEPVEKLVEEAFKKELEQIL